MYGTPQDVMNLTGITPSDLGLEDKANPEAALNTLLTEWLQRITSAITVRLGGESVSKNDPRYHGIEDICIRTTARLVTMAHQQRTNPIVQVGDFTVGTVNTADVTRDLDRELAPYVRTSGPVRVHVFTSIEENEGGMF